jgi:hypothetical protein
MGTPLAGLLLLYRDTTSRPGHSVHECTSNQSYPLDQRRYGVNKNDTTGRVERSRATISMDRYTPEDNDAS